MSWDPQAMVDDVSSRADVGIDREGPLGLAKELSALATMLNEGEHLLDLAPGSLDGFGLLAVTDERTMFVRVKRSKVTWREFAVDAISSVQVDGRSLLLVDHGGNQVVFDLSDEGSTRRIGGAIQEETAAASGPPVAAEGTITYRHSRLDPQRTGREGYKPVSPQDVDAHMNEWAEAGWSLVSANCYSIVLTTGGGITYEAQTAFDVYAFFWRRDEARSDPELSWPSE